MGNILDMVKDFKDLAELKAYADAQFKTIIELNKKINGLEEEKRHLETLLSSKTVQEVSSSIEGLLTPSSDQEVICRVELRKLKEKSMGGDELTLEEAKRTEIYTKLLQSLTVKEESKKEEEVKNVSEADLLTLVTNV